ncbi:Ger(x)C family spore germination protein [Paenibacillus nasutitermitis]|uniref:Spore germination protein KC n=1 Tax=Paenibacillus nasutitermitis TaxID=1652958 RepID=A0A917DWX8_9BACL|nr:Ger(x)C family spore germination protein [Paenibacillus nasutitermitis]GGD76530.1 spore germination protein KC [Paenibacillus nasutitermitis]
MYWRHGILILSLLALCLTGCWDRRELNELGIELGTGYDKIGDQYHVSVQVVDPSSVSTKNSGSVRSPVVMYKASGPTIFETLRKLTMTSPRKIYGAHIRVIIVGESLAREGISKILDLQMRDAEPRPDIYMLVAKNGTAENALKIMTPLEKIPSQNLYASLEASAKFAGTSTKVTLDQLATQLITVGINPVITGVHIIGNQQIGEKERNVNEIDSSARLELSDLAVFEKDRLVGWLNQEESKGYNYILDNIGSTVDHVNCPEGGKLVLETYNSKTSLKSRIRQGEPEIDVKVESIANIGDVECKIDFTNPETIKDLQKEWSKQLTLLMENTVSTIQKKYHSDIFGFGQTIYRNHPKEWSRLKDRWEDLFIKLKVNYDVKVTIRRVGSINNPISNKLRE